MDAATQLTIPEKSKDVSSSPWLRLRLVCIPWAIPTQNKCQFYNAPFASCASAESCYPPQTAAAHVHGDAPGRLQHTVKACANSTCHVTCASLFPQLDRSVGEVFAQLLQHLTVLHALTHLRAYISPDSNRRSATYTPLSLLLATGWHVVLCCQP